jgi:carbon-monoxide dehydrogenase medium subunit
MKPAPFEFESPTTVQEVVERLDKNPEAVLMAGNQSLGLAMANRSVSPDHIIDLNDIEELAFIDESNGVIEIGAMTRHRELEQSTLLEKKLPALSEAAYIAGPSVRNRGTIGGSIAEADPAGNYPTTLSALGASLTVRSAKSTRELSMSEYFDTGDTTVLRENELIERVTIPKEPFPLARTGMAFEVLKRAGLAWPTVSAAAAVRVSDTTVDDPIIEEARLALANVDDTPLRVKDAETAVEGQSLSEDTLSTVAELIIKKADPKPEMHADREYKEDAACEYARRALKSSFNRAIRS